MKVLVSAIVVVILMIGAQSAFASTPFESGFQHGVADAKLDNTNSSKLDYVQQPGKGLDNHTPEFANGYVKGWCSIMGPNTGKELDDTVFDCERS